MRAATGHHAVAGAGTLGPSLVVCNRRVRLKTADERKLHSGHPNFRIQDKEARDQGYTVSHECGDCTIYSKSSPSPTNLLRSSNADKYISGMLDTALLLISLDASDTLDLDAQLS